MESLKKVITLNQAAKQSGYSQDYLGYLIRQGELKGTKVGRSWVTTQEEIQNYLFKQKVRHEKLPIRGFFSRRRRSNIFLMTLVLFVGIFSVVFYVAGFSSSKNATNKQAVTKTLSSDAEVIEVIKQ